MESRKQVRIVGKQPRVEVSDVQAALDLYGFEGWKAYQVLLTNHKGSIIMVDYVGRYRQVETIKAGIEYLILDLRSFGLDAVVSQSGHSVCISHRYLGDFETRAL